MKKSYTLTGLLEFCKENFGEKQGGKPFTISDIQGYVRRGSFPQYLGGYVIKQVDAEGIGIIMANPVYKIEK